MGMDTAVYNSGDYVVLQSGSDAEKYAGVLFVVHRSLEQCIRTFTPISPRLATLTFRTTGGAVALVLTCLPYEIFSTTTRMSECPRMRTMTAPSRLRSVAVRLSPLEITTLAGGTS